MNIVLRYTASTSRNVCCQFDCVLLAGAVSTFLKSLVLLGLTGFRHDSTPWLMLARAAIVGGRID